MPTPKKAATIEHLTEELAKARLAILSDYRGLTVAEISRLRRQLRESDTNLEVAKNTLLQRAAAQVGVEDRIGELLKGPTAVAFSHQQDIGKVAKTLSEYARMSKAFAIKGAVLSRRVLGAEDVQRLAELPPREVLLARAVGGMQAPYVGLVTVLGGTVRGLLNVLQARKEQLAQQGG